MLTFTKYTIQEIAKYTNINAHNISRAYVCHMMGENELSKKFSAIERQQQEIGYLTEELQDERLQLNKSMNSIGAKKVSNWDNINRYL